MEKRVVIIGTVGAGLLGLALVLTLSWLLSLQPRGAAFRGPPSQHFQHSGLLALVSRSENRGQAPGWQQPATARLQVSGFSKGPGLDTGLDAIKLADVSDDLRLPAPRPSLYAPTHASGRWMRLRGIDLKKVPETRQALHKLRADGLRTCVFLRRSVKDWKAAYLPDDLRETYQHGRQLGAALGDLVDAWEVDNEPDLGFVPESAERYTAFLKAMYLGIKAGSKEQGARSHSEGATILFPVHRPLSSGAKGPIVLMGSLGLPPGPWLERFAANDGFAYTDGYNYHYYGYAEDFTGVYRQHERAVAELSAKRQGESVVPSPFALRPLQRKALPIFLTEVGYGMLGKQDRDTKEGRLRQWRWFKSVGEQVAQLRIEGAMAFYLPPYLEYDTSEYGMTVPAVQKTEDGGQRTDLNNNFWVAGAIEYSAEDFGSNTPEPWMKMIGKEVGGSEATPALAWWLAARKSSGFFASVSPSENRGQTPAGQQTRTARFQVSGFSAGASRPWSVTTALPSPVVIDFLTDEGSQSLKRYNGTFVTGNTPPGLKPEEVKPLLPPVVRPPKPPKPLRSEEFMVHVRTENGNLYEVYPTRMATSDWQTYLEQKGNFTMSFYGRAELPWRFNDNRPVSLVVVMYPKQLPATYEFKRLQLIRLGENQKADTRKLKAEGSAQSQLPATNPQLSAFSSQVPASYRYGQGKIVLYNFSDKSVTGKLLLPEIFTADLADKADGRPSVESGPSVVNNAGSITLASGERREVFVNIKVSADRYERVPVEIAFVPIADNPQLSGLRSQVSPNIPAAYFVTEFFPALEGLKATVVADLAKSQGPRAGSPDQNTLLLPLGSAQPTNRDIIANRPRATEEAQKVEPFDSAQDRQASSDQTTDNRHQTSAVRPPSSPSPYALSAFAQPGAAVERTATGFAITVTSIPPGKPQRVEVEIPWPDELGFKPEEFLSMEFRIR